MIKNKNINSALDIQEMFTYVSIDEDAIEKLPEEIKNDWGLDEYCTTLSLADAEELALHGQIEYSDIDYDWVDFDLEQYNDYLSGLVKKASHYLVYLPNSTWSGNSGCGIVNSLEYAFYRSYDCHQYVKAVSKGNKAVLLKESHHDVPMGHHALIIALTDKEYSKLENASFTEMEDFAYKFFNRMVNYTQVTKVA